MQLDHLDRARSHQSKHEAAFTRVLVFVFPDTAVGKPCCLRLVMYICYRINASVYIAHVVGDVVLHPDLRSIALPCVQVLMTGQFQAPRITLCPADDGSFVLKLSCAL